MRLPATRLQGKVAIVTGAGRGIGRAIARRFADEGASVALVSRSAAPLDEAVALISADGGNVIGIQCDMTDRAAIPVAVAKIVSRFGTIDILVNNAHDTSVASTCAPFAGASVDQMLQQFASGPLAAVLAMQACLPNLKTGGGRVINIASGSGVMGMINYLPYAMAKEALRAATRVAAREWAAFGITVNSICPIAETDGTKEHFASGVLEPGLGKPLPIARLGSAYDDIAPLVAFLASDDSRYLTGYTYMADGGGSMDAAR